MRRGFSLIEILVAIFILAFGLLGLGALFPVVVREQRISSDATMGVIVSNSARSVFSAVDFDSGMADFGGQPHPFRASSSPGQVWTMLAGDIRGTSPNRAINTGIGAGWRESADNSQPFENGEWFIPDVDNDGGAQVGNPSNVYLSTAIPSIFASTRIPLRQRLYPDMTESSPLFVWDYAVQRVTDGVPGSYPGGDPLRAAIFVRRLDPRLRSDGEYTVRRRLLDPAIPAAERRLPVGADSNGVPTLDGTDGSAGLGYSAIMRQSVEFWFTPGNPARNHRDRLYVPAAITPEVWSFMRQPGQKLVDNLGNIYTVVGIGEEPGVGSGRFLKIDPPVPASIGDRQARPLASRPTSSGTVADREVIREVAFTPQVPVSVTLVEVRR